MPFVCDPVWQALGEAVATGDRTAAAMLLDRARDDASKHLPLWLGKKCKFGSPEWLRDAALSALIRKHADRLTGSGQEMLRRLAGMLNAAVPAMDDLRRWDNEAGKRNAWPGYPPDAVTYFREPCDSPKVVEVVAFVCVLAQAMRQVAFLAYRSDDGPRKQYPFLLGWQNRDARQYPSGTPLRLLRWTGDEKEN